MLTAVENELLCRVEGDGPDGPLDAASLGTCGFVGTGVAAGLRAGAGPALRRKARCVSRQQRKARLLGESCPHRKASLAFGRNEQCGLRCLYHGWKFDTEGTVIDMPSEPKASVLPEKARHLSYPTREAGGFVWTYMGPQETMPEFEAPPWAPHTEARVAIAKVELPCNWAQIMEGQIDSAHSSTLHSSDMRPAKGDAVAKEITGSVHRPTRTRAFSAAHQYGMRYAAIRVRS